jgi:predicted methyltransferase
MLVSAAPVLAAEPYTTDTGKKIYEQLSSSSRRDEHRARDANRKPVETLEYYGLDDMTVVELLAGSGWHTSILAPVLKDNGKLYVALGTQRLEPHIDKYGIRDMIEVAGQVEGFAKTDMPGYIFDIASVDLEVKDVDLILTFRNIHNLSASARKVVNDATFRALKPGGIYGVIDHTKRHMEPFSAETWRRIDPVVVINEALDAGFELVDFSGMHAIAEDGLVHDTTHESL